MRPREARQREGNASQHRGSRSLSCHLCASLLLCGDSPPPVQSVFFYLSERLLFYSKTTLICQSALFWLLYESKDEFIKIEKGIITSLFS